MDSPEQRLESISHSHFKSTDPSRISHSKARSIGNLPYSSAADHQTYQLNNFSDSTHEETILDHETVLDHDVPRSRELEKDRSSRASYSNSRNNSPRGSPRISGLGGWLGPGANNTPYGKLGIQEDHNQSASNLLFAEGDFITPPSNGFSRFIFKIFESSFLVRWVIYILPILILIWIPGIVGLTAKPDTKVWSVALFYWSVFLSVVWVGWFGSQLAARIAPVILRHSVALVIPESKHYITYLAAVEYYVGALSWAIVNWITINPLINNQVVGTAPAALHLITQFEFGLVIILSLLLAEKVVIQVIAHSFHKKSYQDRIQAQKSQIFILVQLYRNSRNTGRRDTLDGAMDRPSNSRKGTDPTVIVKQVLKGVKQAAQFSGTMLGSVASEFAGETKALPNSAHGMVLQALGSSNKSKQLARRIFYSFVPSYRTALVLDDILRYFENREAAERAFVSFDRDGNGDVSLEEIEAAVLDVRNERKSLASSMKDLDSAVSRLDSILVSVWWVVSAIVMAGLLNSSFETLIAGAGTLILGLSWLFALSAQEVLASIIFVFVKHAYDVGDKVLIDAEYYIVQEMHLLSTVFKRIDGSVVQAPHSILNTKFILNVRRSGPINEVYLFDVAFETTFDQIEQLRARMLEFVEVERRDFLPKIDLMVKDFAGHAKLTLSIEINYKSNWQLGALKAQRRNKFIIALKNSTAALKIFGPADAGNPNPAPADPIHSIVTYAVPEGDGLRNRGEKN